MQWVVTTGATVDEARARALDALGIDASDLELEVLDEPGSALFGLVRTDARVRARVKPTRPRPKLDRRTRRKAGGRNGRKRRDGGRSGGKSRQGRQEEPDQQRRSRRSSAVATSDPDARADDGREAPSGDEGPGVVAPSGDAAGGSGTGRSRRRRRPGRSSGAEVQAAVRDDAGRPDDAPASAAQGSTVGPGDEDAAGPRATPDARAQDQQVPDADGHPAGPPDHANTDRPPAEGTTGADMSDISLDQQETSAVEFLEGLLDAFGADADVASEMVDDGETLEITVEGEDLGLLVGQRGATLNALQELTRTAVAQQHAGRLEGRLRVDVAGYRARRKEALIRFTEQQAARVVETGTKVALEPMSPPDRKIVHDAVNEIDGVRTVSEGEDRRRHVVILPDS